MSHDGGLIKVVTDFVAHLTKEPAEETGGMVADCVRYHRLKQAVRLKEKFQRYLDERGVTETRRLPHKLIHGILDGATLEEDDDLHTIWAKLLANAADPKFLGEVRYIYTEILRALNSFDAMMLNEIYKLTHETSELSNLDISYVQIDLFHIAERRELNLPEILLSSDCLIRQRLILQMLSTGAGSQRSVTYEEGELKLMDPELQVTGISRNRVKLTSLGLAFCAAVGDTNVPDKPPG